MSLYLIINFASLIVPLLFSFHPKLAFYKRWLYLWPAIILTGIPFIIWDICFTEWGIWGFNPSYISGYTIFNLPLEEVLFFICIPYACLFTYHCFNVLIKKDLLASHEKRITASLLIFLTSFAYIFSGRLYTSMIASTLSGAWSGWSSSMPAWTSLCARSCRNWIRPKTTPRTTAAV